MKINLYISSPHLYNEFIGLDTCHCVKVIKLDREWQVIYHHRVAKIMTQNEGIEITKRIKSHITNKQ